jgi:hypothetical protein
VFNDLREQLALRVFAPLFGTSELHCSKDGFALLRPTGPVETPEGLEVFVPPKFNLHQNADRARVDSSRLGLHGIQVKCAAVGWRRQSPRARSCAMLLLHRTRRPLADAISSLYEPAVRGWLLSRARLKGLFAVGPAVTERTGASWKRGPPRRTRTCTRTSRHDARFHKSLLPRLFFFVGTCNLPKWSFSLSLSSSSGAAAACR